MFTPQRKGWSATPRAASEKNAARPWKGKGVASVEGPPPPRDSLDENGVSGGSAREAEVWKSFRDAGMLDDEGFERRDREALLQRVDKLDKELYDYQYNMGLVLIEKQELASKYNELQQALIDAEEILKREQAAHLAIISEMEKREANLKKALGVEKHCVTDLENALREMRAGHAGDKFTFDKKMDDANALLAKTEEKSLNAEAKQRAADASLSELNRKSSEIERKSQDLAAQESILQRERASLNIEKELHAEELSRQRVELQNWEKSLREGQERLAESQNLLNQRERRLNENDKIVSRKEKELDSMRDTIEKTIHSLRDKEEYVNLRLTALSDKEKEDDKRKEFLENKEKELVAKEEELIAREQVEIQKVVAEHLSAMDTKKHEFEMEMEAKRHTFNEEMQKNLNFVEEREGEMNRKEEELVKRESILEGRVSKLADEKNDLDMQSKLLKTREENLKIKEMEVQKKACQIVDNEQEFAISKAKLEVEWKHVKTEKARILAETESLKVTEQEHAEFHELQSKLKEELEECRMLKELISKECDELKHDRENFEREWDVLDEKKASLSLEAKQLNEEKEGLEKWKCNEEERLEKELIAARANISRELDELKLKKEAFEQKMELEKSQILEKLQQERRDMDRELENKQHELQIEMQKKLEVLENKFKIEVAEFNKMKETELGQINSLRETSLLDMQMMKRQRCIFEREKEEYISQRKKIEEAQIEIQNDIDSMRSLSRNLKSQREEFIREREHFLSLVNKYKICQNCGVTMTELAVPCFHYQKEIENSDKALLASLSSSFLEGQSAEEEVSPMENVSPPGASSGRMSWLRSCTQKIFSFSPGKKNQSTSIMNSDGSPLLNGQRNRVEPVSRNSLDNQGTESNDLIHESESLARASAIVEAPGYFPDVEGNPLDIHGDALEDENGLTGMEPMVPPVDAQDHFTTLSVLPGGSSGPEPKTRGKGRAKRKPLKRTRSVQAVVEESKSILGKNANTETNMGKQEDIFHTNPTVSAVGHKRHLAQTSDSLADDLDPDSDAQSESISMGGLRNKRQTTAPSTQTTTDKRYNLRRSTVAGGHMKGPKNKARSEQHVVAPSHPVVGEVKTAAELDQVPSQPVAKENDEKRIHILQQMTTESIMEATNSSLEKIGEEEDDINGAEVGDASRDEDDWCPDEDATDVDYEDDSDNNRRDASVGKKIWKFFTS